jgi:hypothetical protein
MASQSTPEPGAEPAAQSTAASTAHPADGSTVESPGGSPGEPKPRWRQALARLVASQNEVHAEQELELATRAGGRPIATLPMRRQATVCGTLRSVTLRPRAGVPALEAELYDGSGSLYVVWLGRRHIAGIEPGRQLTVRGRIAIRDNRKVIYNPYYELESPR